MKYSIGSSGQKEAQKQQWQWASRTAGNPAKHIPRGLWEGADLSHNVHGTRVRLFRVKNIYRNIEDLGTPKLHKYSLCRRQASTPSYPVIPKFGLGKIRNNKQTALAYQLKKVLSLKCTLLHC